MADETFDPQTTDEQQESTAETAGKEGAAPDAVDPELPTPRGEEVDAVLEALLFATTQPLNTKRLSVLMNGVPQDEISAALERLNERYQHPECGLTLMEVAGGWQVATRPDVADWVLRLHRHRKRQALTPSLLETLAIVAYKQPLTRAEIESIRGVDCGSGMRSLQDAGLVEAVGRKDTIGKPPLYGTTELFLKTFGLRDLEELPSIGELRQVMQSPMQGEADRTSEGRAEEGASAESEADTEGDSSGEEREL